MNIIKEIFTNLLSIVPAQMKTLMMVTGISTTMTIAYFTFVHKKQNKKYLNSKKFNKAADTLNKKQFAFMKNSFGLRGFNYYLMKTKVLSNSDLIKRKLLEFNSSHLKKLQSRSLIQRNDQLFYNIMTKLVKAKFA